MKKTFEFKVDEEKYMLVNTNPNNKQEMFEIRKSDMQFDTSKFYQYVFEDVVRETEIIIEYAGDENDKVAKRVYAVVSEIASGVLERINKKSFETA